MRIECHSPDWWRSNITVSKGTLMNVKFYCRGRLANCTRQSAGGAATHQQASARPQRAPDKGSPQQPNWKLGPRGWNLSGVRSIVNVSLCSCATSNKLFWRLRHSEVSVEVAIKIILFCYKKMWNTGFTDVALLVAAGRMGQLSSIQLLIGQQTALIHNYHLWSAFITNSICHQANQSSLIILFLILM